MFGISQKAEAYLTNDLEVLASVQYALKSQGIAYDIKTVNSGTQNRSRGTLIGKIGENTLLEVMYYVYVSKKDLEKARYEIDKYLRTGD